MPSDALHDATVSTFERLADGVQGWPEVGAAYDAELAKLSGEPQKLVELGLRTARIYEVQLGNVDVAIERYRAALVADPQNSEAARALDRLYEAGEKWQELAEITKVAITLPDASPEEVIALRFKLAQVNEGPLGDIEAALTAYREVLDVEPEHSPTVAALEAMFGRGVKQAEVAAMLRPIWTRGRASGEARAAQRAGAFARDRSWTHQRDSRVGRAQPVAARGRRRRAQLAHARAAPIAARRAVLRRRRAPRGNHGRVDRARELLRRHRRGFVR